MQAPDPIPVVPPELTGRVAELLAGRGEEVPDPLRVDYVRFKPGIGCVLGLGAEGAPNGLGYARVLDEASAETCYRKYAPRVREQGWVARVPGLPAVFFRFPFDRQVPGLGAVVDPGRVKHVVHECAPGFGAGEERLRGRRTRCEVLRYKPERRGVVRVDAGTRDDRTGEKGSRTLLVRALSGSGGPQVLAVLRAARRAGLAVPEPLGHHPVRCALVTGWLPGSCLADHLDEDVARSALEATGELLARLRRVEVPAGLPVRTADAVREEALAVLDDLTRFGDPVVGSEASDLRARLAEAPSLARSSGPVIVHGDLHHRQILVDGAGVALIDWDEAAAGDPHEDASNLVAHLDLLSLEGRLAPERAREMERGLVAAAGLAPERVSDLAAAQLAKLATVPFRNLRPGWASDTRAILSAAARRAVRATVSS